MARRIAVSREHLVLVSFGDGRTILNQDIEALLDEQVGVEDDEAKGQRQDVVARADLEKVADGLLQIGTVSGRVFSGTAGTQGGVFDVPGPPFARGREGSGRPLCQAQEP